MAAAEVGQVQGVVAVHADVLAHGLDVAAVRLVIDVGQHVQALEDAPVAAGRAAAVPVAGAKQPIVLMSAVRADSMR
nr:hypothetical protein GCM10020093_001610 [Planobispora longispora]